MICEFCSKKYLNLTKQGKERKGQRFCSEKCKVSNRKRPYRKYKKDKCENCGFIPLHSCQLDVDHIDGNNSNNEISNLKTLCANCHRLKTYMNKDWIV